MKRLLCLAICFLLILTLALSLASCRDTHVERGTSSTDHDGVTLSVEGFKATEDGLYLNCVWSNSTLSEVTYGAHYVIERYDGEDWINCMKDDVAFIEIGYSLSPISKAERSYSLSVADVRKDGLYRIRTDCHVHTLGDVLPCSLFATFTVDASFTVAGYHRLTFDLDSWLYEDLKPFYKEGETVEVKISSATDIGFALFANGERLEMQSYTDEYWLYSFVMPSCPMRLTSATYDGFTGPAYVPYIIDIYKSVYPHAETPGIYHYYGEYGGAHVAMLDTAADDVLWDETVADCLFKYFNGNGILVFFEDDFCNLSTALKEGILTEENILEIHSDHKKVVTWLYSE